jgi:hypothetical protein
VAPKRRRTRGTEKVKSDLWSWGRRAGGVRARESRSAPCFPGAANGMEDTMEIEEIADYGLISQFIGGVLQNDHDVRTNVSYHRIAILLVQIGIDIIRYRYRFLS